MADEKKKEDKKAAAMKAAEAEAAAENAPADGEEGGRINAKKIIIFALVPLLILGLGIAGAYYTGHLDGVFGKKEEKIDCNAVVEGDPSYEQCAEQLAEALHNMAPGTFIDVPPMIINLNNSPSSKQPRFLKIVMKVEIEEKKDETNFQALMPRVIDQFQAYLRELRLEDLRGSSGMYRMKIELLSRVRAAAPEIKVRDILFQEVLVQ